MYLGAVERKNKDKGQRKTKIFSFSKNLKKNENEKNSKIKTKNKFDELNLNFYQKKFKNPDENGRKITLNLMTDQTSEKKKKFSP